jgi:Protein of unknown function (DUF4446)
MTFSESVISLTLSNSELSLMALVALGLSALAIVFAILNSGAKRRLPATDDSLRLDEALRLALDGHGEQLKKLEQAVRALNATDKRQQVAIEGGIRRVALLRYDAFEDVGGRLSFSCALLDEFGSGVVLTSINGRQETRVYAKSVTDGQSNHNLSVEEEEAIRQALGSGRPVAEQKLEAR